MRTSHARWLVLPVVALGAAVAVACSSTDHATQGAGPSCKTDCGSGATGGVGSTKDGGASDAGASDAGADAAAGVDVTVTVVTYGEPTFAAADSYQGAATIDADKAGGGTVSVPYGGASGTSVVLADVAQGASWFTVNDASGGQTGIFTTTSIHTLPVNGTLALPVIGRPLVNAIFSKLPVPGVVDTAKAQVLLRFRRKGAPLAGIRPEAAVKDATLVFDSGPGAFTTDAKVTSTGGMILLLNQAVGQGGGSIVMSFVDTNADAGAPAYPLTIPTAANGATFAEIELNAP